MRIDSHCFGESLRLKRTFSKLPCLRSVVPKSPTMCGKFPLNTTPEICFFMGKGGRTPTPRRPGRLQEVTESRSRDGEHTYESTDGEIREIRATCKSAKSEANDWAA